MSFGKRLKSLRLEHEMTQEYVAARLSLSRSTIAGYETKNRQPSQENLTALAGLFRVSVDYLLDNCGDEVTLDITPQAGYPLSEQDLISRYQNLSLESKRDLAAYIHLLEVRDHTPQTGNNPQTSGN